jgi:hypothetical protein
LAILQGSIPLKIGVVPYYTLPLTMHLTKIVVKLVGDGEITLTDMRARLKSLPFQNLKS